MVMPIPKRKTIQFAWGKNLEQPCFSPFSIIYHVKELAPFGLYYLGAQGSVHVLISSNGDETVPWSRCLSHIHPSAAERCLILRNSADGASRLCVVYFRR